MIQDIEKELELNRNISVFISDDNMSAYVKLAVPSDKSVEYTYEDIRQAIDNKGVKMGIDEGKIYSILQEKRYNSSELIASGKEAEDGTDGEYTFFFNTDNLGKPMIREDGSVDYHNMRLFELVSAGDKLVEYTPPTSGVYGYDVRGKLLIPKSGKPKSPMRGRGFTVSEDGTTYYAEIDGKVEYRNYDLNVRNVLTIPGDVDLSTGNIEFNGDIMNPRLNLTATEQVKALVGAETTGSRSVNFECGVKVTQTLANMGLEFTLDAPDDMSVKNELAAMGVEQRGKLAVTMLTTGMYLADGNTSGFSMNSALNSFLQSEINNITKSAMRTVDLSLGLDQSSDAAGNTHTDYSFKFAKRFWNNRFNFVVGGKLSNSENNEQDQSFIDNVSLEYRLDQSAMRYVRMFYNKEADDLLEGRISEYGAGFVWRKKMDKLHQLFDIRSKTLYPDNSTSVK